MVFLFCCCFFSLSGTEFFVPAKCRNGVNRSIFFAFSWFTCACRLLLLGRLFASICAGGILQLRASCLLSPGSVIPLAVHPPIFPCHLPTRVGDVIVPHLKRCQQIVVISLSPIPMLSTSSRDESNAWSRSTPWPPNCVALCGRSEVLSSPSCAFCHSTYRGGS